MRLIGYYAWHSFVNCLKKMFKNTFLIVVAGIVAVFVIMGLIGGVVGNWDLGKSISHLVSASHEKSTHRCARYVREAIEAGGLYEPPPLPASKI